MTEPPTTAPRATRTLPGHQGIWVFVLIDMAFFGLLFLSYALERVQQSELFASSQQALNVIPGLVNMVVLLTSSWFVAMAVHAARENRNHLAARWLGLGFVCGLIFAVIKVIEYSGKFAAGISMLTNDFYMFYFIMTGIHFVHVLGGMIALAVVSLKLRINSQASSAKTVETIATYWHMVDFLWVMLFPLLYMATATARQMVR